MTLLCVIFFLIKRLRSTRPFKWRHVKITWKSWNRSWTALLCRASGHQVSWRYKMTDASVSVPKSLHFGNSADASYSPSSRHVLIWWHDKNSPHSSQLAWLAEKGWRNVYLLLSSQNLIYKCWGLYDWTDKGSLAVFWIQLREKSLQYTCKGSRCFDQTEPNSEATFSNLKVMHSKGFVGQACNTEHTLRVAF